MLTDFEIEIDTPFRTVERPIFEGARGGRFIKEPNFSARTITVRHKGKQATALFYQREMAFLWLAEQFDDPKSLLLQILNYLQELFKDK